jgi:hypothetical protein
MFFNKVKQNNTVNKNFSYSKGKCNLNFTLRTDIKSELKDFLELLKTAVAEVTDELKDK